MNRPYTTEKDALLKRLRRVEGQVRGLRERKASVEELMGAVERFVRTR